MKAIKSKRKFSDKTRARMRKAHLGRKHSPATIAKIKAAKKERDTMVAMGVLKPYRHSEATKKLLSQIARKRAKKGKSHKFNKQDRSKSKETRKEISTTKKEVKKLNKYQKIWAEV